MWMRSSLHSGLSVAALALTAGAASAQAVDALQSPTCVRALDLLQAKEVAEAAARRGQSASEPTFRRSSSPELVALRRAAAQACLGSAVDGRPPSSRRLAELPVVVAPIPGLSRGRPSTPAGSAPSTSAPPNAPPTLVTACDPTGCWTNTGVRLPRAGPNLLGPNGVCTLQGVILHCP